MPDDKADNKRQTWVKLALAAVLTVVFVVVVVVQVKTYSGSETASTENQLPATKVRSDSNGNPAPVSARCTSTHAAKTRTPWPEVDIAQCTAYDPFKAPEGFVSSQQPVTVQKDSPETRQQQVEAAQRQTAQRRAIAELMEAGVNAVLVGADQTTAIVGTQQFQVGQQIHGHRVTAIDPRGIVLEPIDPEPASPSP